jgi:hypothetical protein
MAKKNFTLSGTLKDKKGNKFAVCSLATKDSYKDNSR